MTTIAEINTALDAKLSGLNRATLIMVARQDGLADVVSGQAEANLRKWYTAVLHRDPDPAGLAAWLDARAKGTSMGDIAAAIARSAEAKAKAAAG